MCHRAIKTLAVILVVTGCAGGRRLPDLAPGFWRADGATVAQAALDKGDSGLIVLALPDSSYLAFNKPINVEMDTKHDVYYIAFGDLGIDSVRLESLRDSINTFLQAYNFKKIGMAPE